jgi:hypothetical protein
VGRPKSPYNGFQRAVVWLRGGVPRLKLHTDWEDSAEYMWFAFRFGWTPAQVDALPYWLRVRYRPMGDEWDKGQPGR